MSVLKPTSFFGEIIWLGRVIVPGTVAAEPEMTLQVNFDGVPGAVHGGLTRRSCSRVTAQYRRGTNIRNTRQLSILSEEELAIIAADMGLSFLSPHLLGASMVLRGIPDFSHLPPSARLQSTTGATLVVDLENRPCALPAKGIDAEHPGCGALFKRAAKGRRGVVAWIESEGVLSIGDTMRLHIPDQPPWGYLTAALRR